MWLVFENNKPFKTYCCWNIYKSPFLNCWRSSVCKMLFKSIKAFSYHQVHSPKWTFVSLSLSKSKSLQVLLVICYKQYRKRAPKYHKSFKFSPSLQELTAVVINIGFFNSCCSIVLVRLFVQHQLKGWWGGWGVTGGVGALWID